MERREFLRITGFSTIAAMAVPGMVLTSCRRDGAIMARQVIRVREGGFDYPLPRLSFENAKSTTLTAQNSVAPIVHTRKSRALGYNDDSILGPVLEINSGEMVNVEFKNNLKEDSNIHWHGFILPAAMDGHPKDVVSPGGSFNYRFPVVQRAAAYWYHPHTHGSTAEQVFKGLAGMFIVRDLQERNMVQIPQTEFPLVIQDKRMLPDYSLDYSPGPNDIMDGYLGQFVTVNGAYSPYLNIDRVACRFRVLNGSNARVYNLALSDNATFYVIGSDGGLLEQMQAVTSIMLGPGERADIVVNFSIYDPESELFLISKTFLGGVQGREEFKVMKFVMGGYSYIASDFNFPNLTQIEWLREADAVKTRAFKIYHDGGHTGEHGGGHGGHGGGEHQPGMHTINDKVFDMHRIDERVEAGTTEIWEFDNSGGDEIHPMHVHGVQFQVLSREGGRGNIMPHEKGWKDTVLVMPKEKVKVIIKFPEYKGLFLLHCHNLEHEDDGMMLNYEIV
jgi:blue copper oxidase